MNIICIAYEYCRHVGITACIACNTVPMWVIHINCTTDTVIVQYKYAITVTYKTYNYLIQGILCG